MAASIVANPMRLKGSNARDLLEAGSAMLCSVNAIVDLLAEDLTDEQGQSAVNPGQTSRVLYGVLTNLEMIKESIDSAIPMIPTAKESSHGN